MEPKELTLTVGDTGTITATVSPADATNKTIIWTSSNEAIATVAGGVVTPLIAGTTTITATTVDGGHTATCEVEVIAAPHVGTKDDFLTALDTETKNLEVATVTRKEDDLTVNFRSDVSSSDVLAGAVGLAEALVEIAGPESTLTVEGLDPITLGNADADELIALAKSLLGGKTPAEFLAAGATITSAYTASIDYQNTTFGLDGTISFTAVQ